MRNKKTKKINLRSVLIILVLTTIVATIVTLSRYKSTLASANNQAKIGKPIVETTIEEVELNNMKPGEVRQYDFTIKNNKDQEVTNTNMAYTIEVKTGSFLPLNVELYFAPNGIVQGENLLKNGSITEEKELTINSEEVHSYLLIITWTSTENNYLYSNEIDFVQVILNSYQKNPKE